MDSTILFFILSIIVSGIISYYTIYKILRKKLKNKFIKAVIFLIMLVYINKFNNSFLYPPFERYRAAGWVEEAFSKNPTYAAIKETDKEAYQKIILNIKDMIKSGMTRNQMGLKIEDDLTTIINQKRPYASNEATENYFRSSLKVLEAIKSRNKVDCYNKLHPEAGVFIDVSKYIDADTAKEELTNLGELIKSAVFQKTNPPIEKDIKKSLDNSFDALVKIYGKDASLTFTPYDVNIDKAKVCEMTLDFYKIVLDLPQDTRGMVIKYIQTNG